MGAMDGRHAWMPLAQTSIHCRGFHENMSNHRGSGTIFKPRFGPLGAICQVGGTVPPGLINTFRKEGRRLGKR